MSLQERKVSFTRSVIPLVFGTGAAGLFSVNTRVVLDPRLVSLQCYSNQKLNNTSGSLRLWYCKSLVQSHRAKWCRARFSTQGISFAQPQTIILLLSSKWPCLMCFDTSRGSWHAAASTSAPLSHYEGSSFLLGLMLLRNPWEAQMWESRGFVKWQARWQASGPQHRALFGRTRCRLSTWNRSITRRAIIHSNPQSVGKLMGFSHYPKSVSGEHYPGRHL